MTVRNATIEDLPIILKIYDRARSYMRETGNPNQWGSHNPPIFVLEKDIMSGNLYVLEDEHEIQGVFAFIIGEDPTYRVIDGAWRSDKPYGTIHRIAASGKKRGVFTACIEFCERKIDHLRIDTHQDNRIMQHLVTKHGFRYCGIIHLADGSSRLAYDRI